MPPALMTAEELLHTSTPDKRVELVQTRGFPALGPDLVVEVLSPDDRPGETRDGEDVLSGFSCSLTSIL